MMKIVLVDDEANTERMASRCELLKHTGIDVIPISRVTEVMPILDRLKESISLIVLDMVMPPEALYSLEETKGGTATGLKLLEDIRSQYKEIPIIIVSIRRMNIAATAVLKKYEVSAYLEKPILTSELAASIKAIVEKP
jgi:CheY-like chemotaxis protein